MADSSESTPLASLPTAVVAEPVAAEPVDTTPAPPPDTTPPSSPAPPAGRPFKSVVVHADSQDFQFRPMEREGKSYVVKLVNPLSIQTPVITLATPLTGPDGQLAPFTRAVPSPTLAAFLRSVEDLMLEACLANKATWLRKEVQDDALRSSFKSMFKDGTFKLKLSPDFAVFDAEGSPLEADEVPEGAQLKAIVVLKQLVFGKTEFGAVWRITQGRLVPQPKCLIAEEDAEDPDDACSDTDEFL